MKRTFQPSLLVSRAPPRFPCTYRNGAVGRNILRSRRARGRKKLSGLTSRLLGFALAGSAVAGDRDSQPDSEGLRLAIIRKRADFVAANHGVRGREARLCVLLVKPADAVADDGARFGVTVTRKIGNAVAPQSHEAALSARCCAKCCLARALPAPTTS